MREFDYVVVGAGSAGCAIANRLSADPGVSVALVEAGGRDRGMWLHIPVGYARNIFNPRVTWQFQCGPEPHLNNRMIGWPRGRVLGGSSAINGLLYVRGQAQDFDTWRQLGNVGWSFADVLPYFLKAEDQERGASALHGTGGPLGVSDLRLDNPLVETYVEACKEAGLPCNPDFNGHDQEGVGYYQLTNRRGLRSSTAAAYLRPIRSRANLAVITDCLVERVEIEDRRASGIRMRDGSGESLIRARREVVLAAGAIGSPHLLQLSGIGPGEHLRRAGISVIHDLPGVGENLQDHFQVRFLYECTRRGSFNDIAHSPWRKALAGLDWLLRRRGVLTVGAGVVGVFARTRPELATPDVQFHVIPYSAEKPGGTMHRFSGLTVSVCQLRPESRGHLRVTCADPAAPPAIVANYLATETDRQTTLDGMRLIRRVSEQAAFRSMLRREHMPGADCATDADLIAYARDKGTTIFHPCGTAKMGNDALAVVDARLKVHGIARLRVADASIMPTVTSGNTNAPTIMIGEKAADMILQDARG
jgi:choline dehydrogenase